MQLYIRYNHGGIGQWTLKQKTAKLERGTSQLVKTKMSAARDLLMISLVDSVEHLFCSGPALSFALNYIVSGGWGLLPQFTTGTSPPPTQCHQGFQFYCNCIVLV